MLAFAARRCALPLKMDEITLAAAMSSRNISYLPASKYGITASSVMGVGST